MTERQMLRRMMVERRQFQVGSPDHEYRTRAARKYVWILRGVPSCEWWA